MDAPKISVALCTFNGEKYLPEQLRSLEEQTRLPDELVICDDGSTDGTRDLLTDFAHQTPLNVRLIFNDSNLGFYRNFEKSAFSCTGDLVFFCDQDDIWFPKKIASYVREFDAPEIGVVLSDAELMDENSTPQHVRFSESLGVNINACVKTAKKNSLSFALQNSSWAGMVMAYRNIYSKFLFPYLPNTAHDAWTLRILSGLTRFSILAEPLVYYRIHGKNTIGSDVCKRTIFNSFSYARRPICTEIHQKYEQDLAFVLERMSEFPDVFPPNVLEEYRGKRLHHLNRYLLRTHKINKWLGILRETLTGRYFRYGKGIKNIGMDVLS